MLHPNLSTFQRTLMKIIHLSMVFRELAKVPIPTNLTSAGTDLWLSGGDSTPAHFTLAVAGWPHVIWRFIRCCRWAYGSILSFLDRAFRHTAPGNKQQSIGSYRTPVSWKLGINLSGQNPAGFYTSVRTGGTAPGINPILLITGVIFPIS